MAIPYIMVALAFGISALITAIRGEPLVCRRDLRCGSFFRNFVDPALVASEDFRVVAENPHFTHNLPR